MKEKEINEIDRILKMNGIIQEDDPDDDHDYESETGWTFQELKEMISDVDES